MSKTKRVVKELTLGEISFVDRPAQEGALAVIMKAQQEQIENAIRDTVAEVEASAGAGETVSKKEQLMPDSNAEVAKQLADLQTQVDTLTAERDQAVAKAAMSDAEKSYMSGLDAEAQKAFMAMKPEDRARKMKKSADEDETVDLNGQTIAKSKVGSEMFAVLKAQSEEMAEIRKQAAKDREDAEIARLTKRASDEFAHLPGKADEVAKALREIEAIKDEDVRKSILDVFATAEKTIAAGFAERGHSDGTTAKSKSDFNAKVQEVAKSLNIPQHEAMSKVRAENPDLYEAAFGNS